MNKKKIIKLTENILITILLLIGILIAVSLIPNKNIYKLYTVMSGSMEPTIKVGSVIISIPQKNYEVGDVVTYKDNLSKYKFTTHRIVEIKEVNGKKEIYTKGDANDSLDGEAISEANILGKSLFDIPYLGYLVSYLKNPIGLILIIIIPSTIIIYEEIRKIRIEILNKINLKSSKKNSDKKFIRSNSKRKKKNEKDN